MLRRDTTARFHTSGFWVFRRYHFVAGRLQVTYGPSAHDSVWRTQRDEPVKLMSDDDRRRTWWMYQGEFYWEDEGYDAITVKALVLQRLGQNERRVRRAMTLMEQQSLTSEPRRIFIPQEVRLEVFRRDGGRCVNCGADRDLQFDHVIPVALGGASTEVNLQLLCAACNRDKGASLA